MDNPAQNQGINEDKQMLTPYQQQQLDSWKNKLHNAVLDAWPFVYRLMNEVLLILFKVVRGSVRIAKEQILQMKG